MIFKELYTDRLILREISDEEWDNYYNHVTEADEIFVQYGHEPDEKLLEFIQSPTPDVFYYSIVLKETEKMVGYIGIPEWNNSIEYYIFTEYRRQGFALEALKRFIDAYLDGDITGKKEESVTAEVVSDNEASERLLEKAGFVRLGMGCSIGYRDEAETGIESTARYSRYEYSREETEQL